MTVAPAISLPTALLRGLRGRCPHCGTGRMFARFLKVAEHCPHCGEELHHHRADDLPAYLVILLLGHILIPGIVFLEVNYSPPYWVHAAIWLPLVPLLAIGLLSPCKGAVVAVEWFFGMRGFFPARQQRLAAVAAYARENTPPPPSSSP